MATTRTERRGINWSVRTQRVATSGSLLAVDPRAGTAGKRQFAEGGPSGLVPALAVETRAPLTCKRTVVLGMTNDGVVLEHVRRAGVETV